MASKKELTVQELSEALKKASFVPVFLHAYDQEEDLIMPTFFRAVEWLKLNEFEPWVEVYSREISTAYQGGISGDYSLFPLFYICRSNLALKKASPLGLEAYLYGLCVGSLDESKPWKQLWPDQSSKDVGRMIVDYLPAASIIGFAWQRIKPKNINQRVLDEALLLLFQTQLSSGGWPLTSKGTEGDILSTSLAMIALGVLKPNGYGRFLKNAKTWLLDQQNEVGCWHIAGGPAVTINILCIEAIKLASGNKNLTFTLSDEKLRGTPVEKLVKLHTDKYIVFCEGNPHGSNNKDFDEKCFSKIFSIDFPNAKFFSVGSCTEITSDTKQIFEIVEKTNPDHRIIKLIDRDDRTVDEISDLSEKGVTVLSRRSIESYMLDDEIIEKLCKASGHENKVTVIKEIKQNAIQKSITRNNPPDDLKSASGMFFTETKKALGLTQCGNNVKMFLRDTMAPLITNDTDTYKTLLKDIFGI